MRTQLGLLAVLFLIAHLLSLPPTLEDVDSVNFALGVRDFDVARHQPHPPGYPVFIALAKVSTGTLRLLGVAAAEPRGLALLGVVAAAALVPLLFVFYRNLGGDSAVAWWAMAMAVCSPLLWFTALRPLSDLTGLALVVGAHALLLSAMRDGHAAEATPDEPDRPGTRVRPATLLIAGAALAGFAAGVRAQTVALTGPLLLIALIMPGTTLTVRDRLLVLVAALIGVVVWLVPLIVASGGVATYLAALGTQAGEDFAGVVMLWTTRQSRVAVDAVLNSFVWPWGSFAAGMCVMAVATLGFVRAAWRAPRMVSLLLIAFGPYAVFHLLFHETVTVRYALPLVVPVAFLATYAAQALGRIGLMLTGVSIVIASLIVTLPAARAYARDGSPAFRTLEAIASAGRSNDADRADEAIGMHASMRRVEEWTRDGHHARVVRGPHGREWLALVEHWRKEPDSSIRFVADPRRTDLVLFDPQARSLDARREWSLPEMPFVAGTRPGSADLYTMRPPGWMLGTGWSLTAEVGGVTAQQGLGPHVEPSVAWVRARAEPASVIIGGRNLGGPSDPAARLTLSAESGTLGVWDARPGFFLWHVRLPAGSILGNGYVPLRASAAAADGSGRQVRVSLEQFDLQSDGILMLGFGDGWYEPEYSPSNGRAWRWMSERARLWVRPVGRDVTVTIAGEDPLRYFRNAPSVRVTAAGIEMSRFTPSSDFTHQMTIPAKALALSGGLITLESELWYTPAERGESQDPRHLALRIYSVSAK